MPGSDNIFSRLVPAPLSTTDAITQKSRSTSSFNTYLSIYYRPTDLILAI